MVTKSSKQKFNNKITKRRKVNKHNCQIIVHRDPIDQLAESTTSKRYHLKSNQVKMTRDKCYQFRLQHVKTILAGTPKRELSFPVFVYSIHEGYKASQVREAGRIIKIATF